MLLLTLTSAALTSAATNASDDDTNPDPDIDCGKGVLLPVWKMHKDISIGKACLAFVLSTIHICLL
jgi:hypothetical protein